MSAYEELVKECYAEKKKDFVLLEILAVLNTVLGAFVTYNLLPYAKNSIIITIILAVLILSIIASHVNNILNLYSLSKECKSRVGE